MSEHLNVDDTAPTDIIHDLVILDRVFDNTNLRRELLAKKLESTLEEIVFDKDNPKLIEAQMNIVKTYLDVLNGKDTNIRTRVGSKLKQVETESSSKQSSEIAEFLSRISINHNFNLGSGEMSPDIAAQKIDSVFESSGLDPILESELKIDPTDLA